MPRGVPGRSIPRKVTKAWLAQQLGVHRNSVSGWARDKATLNMSNFPSICRFVVDFLDRRGHLDPSATPKTLLTLAGRNLRLCGIAAQRLSIGSFAWAPVAGGAYAYAGELAGELEAHLGAELDLPPFAARLAALDDLVRRGLGSLPEAQRLLAEVGSVVGPDDAVLARLRLRAAVQGVPRG